VDVAAQVEQIADLGFDLIELNTDLTIFFPHCYDLPALERLRRVYGNSAISAIPCICPCGHWSHPRLRKWCERVPWVLW